MVRVISRLFAIEEEVEKAAAKKEIQTLAQALVENSPSDDTAESLIELGALVCQKTAKCDLCPISSFCLAKKRMIENRLPLKKEREKNVKILRNLFILEWNDHWLIRKETKELMKGLYHFFYLDAYEFSNLHRQREDFLSSWKDEISEIEELPLASQTFTKYLCTLFPFYLRLHRKIVIDGYRWIPKKEAISYPFSSGPRKILEGIYL